MVHVADLLMSFSPYLRTVFAGPAIFHHPINTSRAILQFKCTSQFCRRKPPHPGHPSCMDLGSSLGVPL